MCSEARLRDCGAWLQQPAPAMCDATPQSSAPAPGPHLLVGQRDLDLAVQPPRPHEGGVQHVWPVGGRHQLDLRHRSSSGEEEEGEACREGSGTSRSGRALALQTALKQQAKGAAGPAHLAQLLKAVQLAQQLHQRSLHLAAAWWQAYRDQQQWSHVAGSRGKVQCPTGHCHLLTSQTQHNRAHLSVRAGSLAEALAADGINLIHEDDAGLVLPRVADAGGKGRLAQLFK